jgi:DNA topoisomerase-1
LGGGRDLLSIDFIGKKGVRNVAECDNKIIYEYLYNKYTKSASKEDYVFTYDGAKVITSADVNEYLKVICNKYSKKGEEPIIITTKDLRTWNANTLFLTYYKKLRKSRDRCRGKDAKAAVAADTEKTINKDIKTAIEMVAQKLHNSYSICRKSYIDPKIIEDLLSRQQS